MNISEYIDYLGCSYKVTHYSKLPPITFQHAKAITLSETSRFFFSGVAKNGKVSLKVLRDRLGKTWNLVRMVNKLEYDWQDIVSIQEQLTKVACLVGPDDHVILTGYPTTLDTDFDSISGSVDAIIVKNQSTSNKYLQVVLFDYFFASQQTRTSPSIKLMSSYYDMALRKDRLTMLPRKYVHFRLNNSQLHSLAVTRYEDKRTIKLLNSIYKGIVEKVNIPTVYKDTCRECAYSLSCNWSQA